MIAGARVAYRMALDHPDCVERLSCLDIIPTHDMWRIMDDVRSHAAYHWHFLAQPAPMPETLIMADPAYYLDHTIASWARSRDLASFDTRAMDHYRATFASFERVHAACEDYRAGWFLDKAIDNQDREAGRKITCPTLVVSGPASKTSDPSGQDRIWREWADDVTCATVEAGHFVAEEAPEETLEHLLGFLTKEG
ncbi:alpha/beta hydrolase [uncultured Cohaesibacter sp.]|uniref:alpha/beta fold hydrolase n=1 Tax=uncultured Cohaesibacter sp. TaxID=1002546 RepID=UPI0029C7C31D|nr:alpha/beta hydrolase [uncultured Cohaesibacter sp.]